MILNLFGLMVDANVPDIALEPDKTVKKVARLLVKFTCSCFYISSELYVAAWMQYFFILMYQLSIFEKVATKINTTIIVKYHLPYCKFAGSG